ncbi:TPA: AAA family ATPase [Burkholderia vietnamiensis]|nr:AAA family ATPase [Burkholderia vietnamiensis]
MILLELQLNNFRQFYGLSPVIKFATGPGSVNVLYGSNGAGKTAKRLRRHQRATP